ncbi:hypothetical protein LTR37_018526 [Vermiconidia calcicola]|uniref:Uncharacterized protein n=1 Tax=Vermiconidia calcicola TaxID=1690605 RepID=A0ACC3MIJ4_9PEZI|nr:hypothetical protein LTR37_018526 [Vermiconidia calcicola]
MSHSTENTFRQFDQGKANVYAQVRRDYQPSVYETIVNQHTSTGGQLDTLIDVGCGPGMVLRTLAPNFNHAIGLDASEGMIAAARSANFVTGSSEPVRFEVGTAEELTRDLPHVVQDASVDLITVANAAHWFDMPKFWQSAARVLKPGGSVAVWTSGEIRVHPSVPNAAAIEAAMYRLEEHYLTPYRHAGNKLVRNGYVDLPLPWTLTPPVNEFDESTFLRRVWDPKEEFFTGQREVDLDTFEKMMGTGSAVVRWREAHPHDVGTERDVVKMQRREIERLLHEGGVKKGEERVRGAVQGVVLVVKKRA